MLVKFWGTQGEARSSTIGVGGLMCSILDIFSEIRVLERDTPSQILSKTCLPPMLCSVAYAATSKLVRPEHLWAPLLPILLGLGEGRDKTTHC
jgi:hypothetical protein